MEINELVDKYQKQFNLMDWDISCVETEALNTEASTKTLFNDYKASMLIKAGKSDVEKEKSIIHELLHLIFRDAYDIFADTVEDEFAKTYCERQHERAIEKTAKIIYQLNR